MKKIGRGTKVSLVLVLAVAMLAAVAFTGAPSSPGYEAFKEMLKAESSHTDTSESATVALTVTDNEKEVVKVRGNFGVELDGERFGGAARVESGALVKDLQFYADGNAFYLTEAGSKDVYVGENDKFKHDREDSFEGSDEPFSKNDEAIFDFFMKDIAKEFEVKENQDGSKVITLDITESEMPAIVNLLAGGISDKNEEKTDEWKDLYQEYPLFQEMDALAQQPDDLVANVTVHSVRVEFHTDAQYQLQKIYSQLSLSGDNADGVRLLRNISMNFDGNSDAPVEIRTIATEGMKLYQLPTRPDQE